MRMKRGMSIKEALKHAKKEKRIYKKWLLDKVENEEITQDQMRASLRQFDNAVANSIVKGFQYVWYSDADYYI